MSTTLKLVPNTLHCVKSGLAIITITEGAIADGAKLLNKVLAEGKVIAGVNPGRLLLCEELRSNASKKYWWGTSKAGKVKTGSLIGQHNEAVLKTFGLKADPTTLSKGQVGRRQYGTHFEEAMRPTQATAPSEPSTPVFGNAQPKVVLAQPTTQESEIPNTLVSVGDCPLPSPTERKGKGCYPRWIKKCKALGFSPKSAKAAWDEGKQSPIVEPAVQPKVVHSPIAKRKPSAPAASSEGTVLHVKPESLQAVLSAIGEAKVDFDADAGVFTVVTL